jgi:hypothetical protein
MVWKRWDLALRSRSLCLSYRAFWRIGLCVFVILKPHLLYYPNLEQAAELAHWLVVDALPEHSGASLLTYYSISLCGSR